MRKHEGPITEDVILQYLSADLALYHLSMPGDSTTASILSTRVGPHSIKTWYETIELDDLFLACVEYLVQSGAPAFKDAEIHRRYMTALEEQLSQGAAPREARDTALRVVNRTTSPASTH